MPEQHRWIVEIDGEVELYRTRAEARKAASWHRRHPRNVDLRRYGPYRDATGQPHVLDRADGLGRLMSVAATLRAYWPEED